MRFFVVGRDRETGAVRTVTESPFATRQAAVDALGAMFASEPDLDTSDLFVVDLDVASPVVLFKPPVAAEIVPEAVEEPLAEAWETPAYGISGPSEDELAAAVDAGLAIPEEGLLVEPGAEAPEEEVTADTLADALRRAAASLEAEGVQPAQDVDEILAASQSAEATPTSEVTGGEVPLAVETTAADEAAPAATEAPEAAFALPDDAQLDEGVDAEPEGASAAVTEEAPQWPWDEVLAEAVAETEALGETEETGEDELDEAAPEVEAPVEVAAVVEPMSVAVSPEEAAEPVADSGADAEPAAEPTAEPAPEYVPSGLDEPAAHAGEMIAPPPSDELPDWAVEMLATGAETPTEDAGDAAEAPAALDPTPSDEGLGAASDAVADPPADAADDPNGARGYEPAALDMGQYTCDECVYVATCPKHHQDSPSTCGSFQWKSV